MNLSILLRFYNSFASFGNKYNTFRTSNQQISKGTNYKKKHPRDKIWRIKNVGAAKEMQFDKYTDAIDWYD